ncbi:MAG: class I SAM-dependent methyltransferase [Steroidobacteraceae bacterium]
MTESAGDAGRRLDPRLWDHDFILLKRLSAALRAVVARHLAHLRDLTVIDYGCGSMPYRPLFDGCAGSYIGVDCAGNDCADLQIDTRLTLPFTDSSADVVLSSEVLEHVEDVGFYLGECARVLRTSGMLLLSTHGMWIYHPHPTDVRRWTRWGLRFEIERAGFVVADIIPCVGPLAYTTQLRLLLLKGLLAKLGVCGRILCAPVAILCQGIMWLEDCITPSWVTADYASVYVVAARRMHRSEDQTLEPVASFHASANSCGPRGNEQ